MPIPRSLNPAAPPPRERLLQEAMRLFSERGFDVVTTREICAAAGVNPGAIHYHFGDKDGLYAEVLSRPVRDLQARMADFDDPSLGLHESICRFLRPFLFDDGSCTTQLFMREMVAPSRIFMTMVMSEIGPVFDLSLIHI